MTTQQLATAVIRLSKAKIGIREASSLLLINNGATIKSLSKALDEETPYIRGRINALRQKRLIHGTFNADGTSTYWPTPLGQAIINSTLGTP